MNLNHFEDFAIMNANGRNMGFFPYGEGWRIIRSIALDTQNGRFLMGRLANPYRGYKIDCHPKAIPDRRWDWDYVHQDYDGTEDAGDNRFGSAASWDACLVEIDNLEDEE